MALKEKYKEELIKIIHKHLPNCTIYLFGSRAINKEYSGSDIDIAVDTGTPLTLDKLSSIQSDFEETSIPMTLDIVDIQTAPEELKKDIFAEGIKWTS